MDVLIGQDAYSNTTLVKVKYSYEEAVTALGYRFKYNSC